MEISIRIRPNSEFFQGFMHVLIVCKFEKDQMKNSGEKLLYNVVSTLAPSFLIGSSSYLQVTRTSITSRTCSKFGQIRPRTAEVAALERLEKSP